jgi:DNA-binding response OmpR family regulator
LIAEELTDRGFEMVIAHEGHEGFISILKGISGLVLCDVGLPQMSGFEVLERLNQLSPRLEKVPFVFLTALAGRDDELHGRLLGADDYVTKRIDFDILESIINARLAGVARLIHPYRSASSAIITRAQNDLERAGATHQASGVGCRPHRGARRSPPLTG